MLLTSADPARSQHNLLSCLWYDKLTELDTENPDSSPYLTTHREKIWGIPVLLIAHYEADACMRHWKSNLGNFRHFMVQHAYYVEGLRYLCVQFKPRTWTPLIFTPYLTAIFHMAVYRESRFFVYHFHRNSSQCIRISLHADCPLKL